MDRPRILVVDDDQDGRRELAWRLRADGHQVTELADPFQAVIVVCTEAPDLVVLRTKLSRGEGLQLFERYAHLSPVESMPLVLVGHDGRAGNGRPGGVEVAASLHGAAPIDDVAEAVDRVLREVDPAGAGRSARGSRWRP